MLKDILTMRRMTTFIMLLCLSVIGQHAFAQTSGTVTYVYTDPQGTPLAEADASGNITATFDYTPYGTTALGTPPNGPGYTGHVNDPETNLVYMQARYYDSATGRMLSVDPVTPEAGDMFRFNRYDYALDNPIRNTDPNGKDPCQSCDDISGVSLFLGSQLRTSGTVRQGYVAASAQLDPADGAGRTNLKEETRANTPSMVRRAIEATRPSTAPKDGSGGRANVTNESANAAGEVLRGAGNALLIAGAAISVYSVATSDNKTRSLASAGGATLGGIGGGEGGAWAGGAVGAMLGGPPGALVGAIAGGLGGSAAGAHYGSKGATKLYDNTTN